MKRDFVVFNGFKFYRMSNGYYKGNSGWLHAVVWKAAHGEIPEGCEIHHVDLNPSNNALENLQCLTIAEHKKIHARLRPTHAHICEQCGKIYTATNYTKKNRFCSKTCRIAWLRKQGYYDVVKKCEYCGAEFKTRTDQKARYCSNSCAKKAAPLNHRANGQFAKNNENVTCKLTDAQRAEICKLYATGEYSQRGLAKIFDVSQMTIRRIIHKGG